MWGWIRGAGSVGLVWELSLPWTSQQLCPSPVRSCLSALQELLQPKQPMWVLSRLGGRALRG